MKGRGKMGQARRNRMAATDRKADSSGIDHDIRNEGAAPRTNGGKASPNDPFCVFVVKMDAYQLAADISTKEGRDFLTNSILHRRAYPDSTLLVMYVVGERAWATAGHCLVALFDSIAALPEDL